LGFAVCKRAVRTRLSTKGAEDSGSPVFEALACEVASSVGQGALTGVGENRVAFAVRDDVAAAAAGILTGEPMSSGWTGNVWCRKRDSNPRPPHYE
jgi:hypothetical protein